MKKKRKSRKMVLFYSGSTSGKSLPEHALKDKSNGKGPDIMLTFFEIYTMRGDTKTRIFRHITRRKAETDVQRGEGNTAEATGRDKPRSVKQRHR